MAEIKIGIYSFKAVCRIVPKLDSNGYPIVYMPQSKYRNIDNLPLNGYGHGPFCKFKVPNGIDKSGVYALLVNDDIEYIGQCEKLSPRWNTGYGNISPKNCFEGGQSTNCRVNNLILNAFKGGNQINLFFHETKDIDAIEADLINKLKPGWNIKQASGKHFRKQKEHILSRTKSSRNKYQQLTEYLLKSKEETECLTYADIEEILGFKLPYSAYRHRPWWANSGHRHAETWTDVGWRTMSFELGKFITFKKNC